MFAGQPPCDRHAVPVQAGALPTPVRPPAHLRNHTTARPPIHAQLEYLLVNINSWQRYFTPCESTIFAPHIDLVLYISRDDGMLAPVAIRAIARTRVDTR